ncbi:uncharacterized protein LOC134172966 [Pezoporus occidentalis]|uniref:uncharacterized protein LOC134172966 n=1 Tax=Pezoporus occidentalis TaxID=407982 RepID=UPI002F915F90
MATFCLQPWGHPVHLSLLQTPYRVRQQSKPHQRASAELVQVKDYEASQAEKTKMHGVSTTGSLSWSFTMRMFLEHLRTACSRACIPPRETERGSAKDATGSSSAPGKPEEPRFSQSPVIAHLRAPQQPWEETAHPWSERLSALLNQGQGPARSHPAPAGSLVGAAPWSQAWARTGGRYEILALTESRCIIGKPSGHERANSHIPGRDGERFTPGACSPHPAPGRLPASPAPSALIVVLMALLFEADPLAYRGECHYVVF